MKWHQSIELLTICSETNPQGYLSVGGKISVGGLPWAPAMVKRGIYLQRSPHAPYTPRRLTLPRLTQLSQLVEVVFQGRSPENREDRLNIA